MAQELDDALRLLGSGNRDDQVRQVLPLVAAEEAFQLQPQPVSKVRAQIVDDVELGGRRKTGHRHLSRGKVFADEPRDIEVVGPKVVPPLGEAVGLVEHPGRDLAHSDRLGKGAASKLLRRNEHDAGITETDLVQRGPPLERRE